MSEERKPVWPWILGLLIGLPVFYVASFGPACWLADRDIVSWRAVARTFGPLVNCASNGPSWMRTCIQVYSNAAGSGWAIWQLEAEIKIQELERRREATRQPPKSRDGLHWESY